MRLVNQLTETGIKEEWSLDQKRNITLSNKLGLAIIVISVILLVLDAIDTPGRFPAYGKGSWGLVFFCFFGLVVLALNRFGANILSRIVLSILPIASLLLWPLMIDSVEDEYYFWYPFAAVIAAIAPQIIFSVHSEKLWFSLGIVMNLALLSFILEYLIAYTAPHLRVVSTIQEIALFYRIIPYTLFAFLVASVFYLKSINSKHELLLLKMNNELDSQNAIIERQKNKILDFNEELQAQNEELQASQEELSAQNQEMYSTLEELRLTQAQLIQTEKMATLGNLTAGIAHEINNPSNFIKSGVEGLRAAVDEMMELNQKYETLNISREVEGIKEIEDFKKEISYNELQKSLPQVSRSILNGVNRITEIIDSLRLFTKKDVEQPGYENLHDNINATLNVLQNDCKSHIEVIKEYGKIPKVQCYIGKINQVFLNVISNALQAMHNEGQLHIRTFEINKYIRIIIEDNGEGISPNDLPKVFEPFFTTRNVGEGSGLGLFTSYQIVHEHNGVLQVHSNQGEGTTVTIDLPKEVDI